MNAVEPREFNTRPCWRDSYELGVFDEDGKYLGSVEVPEVFYNRRSEVLDPAPFMRGNTVLVAVQDEAGTIMVKRYRLVLPGER